MDYDSHTLIQLKTMCKDRGLRVSGTKAEVIIRLMEDDESILPTPVMVPTQTIQMHPQHHQVQPVTHIYVNNNSDLTLQLTGIGILLYGIFRIGMALLFNEWMPAESFLAMLIGLGFILGGVTTIQGYKQGLQLTLGVLVVSGILSLINHDEFSPLSIGMGGFWPVWLSLLCSGTCMIIVATPLLGVADSQFRAGSPNYMTSAINTADFVSPAPLVMKEPDKRPATEGKIVTKCVHCQSKLKVPIGYKGRVKCPTCNERFKVE